MQSGGRWGLSNWPLWAKLAASFVIVLLLAVAQAAYAYRTILATRDTSALVEHTYQVISLAGDTRAGFSAMRSAYRSFVLTGNDQFYQSYRAAQDDYRAALSRLRQASADNPAQVERWRQVGDQASEWERDVAQPRIDLRRSTGRASLDAGDATIAAIPTQFIEIDRLFTEGLGLEKQLLDERQQRAESARRQLVFVLIGGIAAIALVSLALATLLAASIGRAFGRLAAAARQLAAGELSERIHMQRGDEIGQTATAFNVMADQLQQLVAQLRGEVQQREQAERDLEAANTKLTDWVAELEQRDGESSLLAETGELLQACDSLDEAQRVLSSALPRLLPGVPAAVCIINESQNVVEVLAQSNAELATQPVFAPDDCWALRLGRPHRAVPVSGGVSCSHLVEPPAVVSLCLPMVAQGKSLGLLHVAVAARDVDTMERSFRDTERLASALAHQIGLAVANLKLRQTLRTQALRDSLTGLFNRRYFQDTLEREISRAQRRNSPLSVIMLDIDHFKQLNDTFGHQVGDEVLRQVARVLQAAIRSSDLACRYGGEEFMLILPDAAAGDALRRAEHIRESIADLPVTEERRTYGPVTVSLGVAAFPLHGPTVDVLVQSVDRSLYRAKRAGRNRVEMAELEQVDLAQSL